MKNENKEIKGSNFKVTNQEDWQVKVETIGLVNSDYFDIYSATPTALAALCTQQQAALVEMAGMLIRHKESYEQIKQKEGQKAESCGCGKNEGCGDCVVDSLKAINHENKHSFGEFTGSIASVLDELSLEKEYTSKISKEISKKGGCLLKIDAIGAFKVKVEMLTK